MKITVRFIRAGFPMGLAYFAGDVADLEEKTAKELIELQFAIPVEEIENTDLPEDIPCRDILLKNEIYSITELKKIENLQSLDGIGKKSAEAITTYLNSL